MTKNPIDDVNLLRHELFQVAIKNAKGKDGAKVMRCLKEMSEEMYASGIDESLRMTEKQIKNWDNIASAWDLTWLTLLALKLKQL